MKKIVTILIGFLIYTSAGITQYKTSDSLKTILTKTNDPLERFNILNRLSEDIFTNGDGNIESSLCTEMLTIARELDNDSLLAIGYNMAGNYFFSSKGDNTTGLEYLFKALPLAEKINDKHRVSSLYFDIAFTYSRLEIIEEAIKYNRKGAANLPAAPSPMYNFM
ncbi:MAG: hypothetical protein WKI04_11355 [Ferruginibacter sp.]